MPSRIVTTPQPAIHTLTPDITIIDPARLRFLLPLVVCGKCGKDMTPDVQAIVEDALSEAISNATIGEFNLPRSGAFRVDQVASVNGSGLRPLSIKINLR